MKIKNGIFILVMGFGLMNGARSSAIVFPDQVVENGHEDENADAVSRFGNRGDSDKKDLSPLLHPISESSFESSGGRSPASVAPVSRSPAGEPARKSLPKSATLRVLKKNKAVQEVAVIANEYGFFPSTVFVTEGLAVRLFITGASAKSQCFMMDDFGVRRQVRSQKVEEVMFTPQHAGRYSFNCPMNGAKGQLVVRQMDLGERSPASVAQGNAESAE
jgi:hypothetical protein